jgi:hypothetical protein
VSFLIEGRRAGEYNFPMSNRHERSLALMVPGKTSIFKQTGARPANFFHGLWHGFIFSFLTILLVITKNLEVFETNNNGWQYRIGYALGVALAVMMPSLFFR